MTVPPATTGASATEALVGSIIVRPLESMQDCEDCVEIQRQVWGYPEQELVPASLLHVVDYVGGIAAGAFDEAGRMVGFVFGITGFHDGEASHWSHMLGVTAAARDMGVGLMLKEHQRRVLAAMGVTTMFWTFDPLMVKNAHFNFNLLGAEIVEYVPDMYGVTESPLHLGLPTDRVIVRVQTAGRVTSRFYLPSMADVPIMTPFPMSGDCIAPIAADFPPVTLVEMPADILDDVARAPLRAATWRTTLRQNFQWALHHGYSMRGVHRDALTGRSFYVWEQSNQTAASRPT